MRFLAICSFVVLTLGACSSGNEKKSETNDQPQIEEFPIAHQIVNNAIEAAGGDKYDKVDISFMFRDIWYRGFRNEGLFSYERKFLEEDDSVHDVLNNEGFTRYINNEVASLPDTMVTKYTNSVNAVLYFMLLPRPLNDDAVIKEYLGEQEIRGKKYHEIKVTFRQEGGGEDFTDEFIYWFRTDDFSMDYFTYLYHTDGGGIRFREAVNPRTVNGIRFYDYINFKREDMSTPVEIMDSLFLAGELEELSRIENTEINVQLLD